MLDEFRIAAVQKTLRETAEQVQMLRDKGCQQVQGYFFSRPLPAAEFEAFLANFEVIPAPL